jgi:hypothetical protein
VGIVNRARLLKTIDIKKQTNMIFIFFHMFVASV